MNFLADESVDRQIVESLRELGHEVIYVAELDPSISDDAVFDAANLIRAILITNDKDFGEIVFRDGRISSRGVILIRLAGLTQKRKSLIVSDAIENDGARMYEAFTVISPGRIRMRASLR